MIIRLLERPFPPSEGDEEWYEEPEPRHWEDDGFESLQDALKWKALWGDKLRKIALQDVEAMDWRVIPGRA